MLVKDEDGFVFDVPARVMGQRDRLEEAMTWLFYGSIVVGNLAILGSILWMAIT